MEEEKRKITGWGLSITKLVQNISDKNSTILSTINQQISTMVGYLKDITTQSHHLIKAETYISSFQTNKDL